MSRQGSLSSLLLRERQYSRSDQVSRETLIEFAFSLSNEQQQSIWSSSPLEHGTTSHQRPMQRSNMPIDEMNEFIFLLFLVIQTIRQWKWNLVVGWSRSSDRSMVSALRNESSSDDASLQSGRSQSSRHACSLPHPHPNRIFGRVAMWNCRNSVGWLNCWPITTKFEFYLPRSTWTMIDASVSTNSDRDMNNSVSVKINCKKNSMPSIPITVDSFSSMKYVLSLSIWSLLSPVLV